MSTSISNQVKNWQSKGYRVGLVTGVFDIIHIEHIRFLTKAKAMGDKLIVGVETDERVSRMKGNHRPINSQSVRIEQLESLKTVDVVFLLPQTFDRQSDWIQFMKDIGPNYYAVSSSSSFIENKKNICDQTNVGFHIVHPYNPNISTTKLIHASPSAEEPQA